MKLMVTYEVTEYGKRVIPHLLKHFREKQPEAWKAFQEELAKLPKSDLS